MNVVDSSGWLEYFADGPGACFFDAPIEDTDNLVVPVLTLYEVFRRIASQRDEGLALQAIAAMQQGKVVDVDAALALEAAHLGLVARLPMADAIILAIARRHGAVLWTQDADFEGLDGVMYRPRVG